MSETCFSVSRRATTPLGSSAIRVRAERAPSYASAFSAAFLAALALRVAAAF